MLSYKRGEYLSFRIEARSNDCGWQVTVYRRVPGLPSPPQPDRVSYQSHSSAIAASERDVHSLRGTKTRSRALKRQGERYSSGNFCQNASRA
jgi:hypothetical protein